MSLISKEAKVCDLLNKYVEKKVKELAEKCDSNWLIHDEGIFRLPKNREDTDRRVTVYVDTEIKNILFRENEIYYIPKYCNQENVVAFIKAINEEYERILKQYNEYESLVDSNINTLETLLDM